ncbi:MAG: hypothetical protein LBR75_03395 [Prevotellaceae bacterium]|nr:hypothetical protein [Prevotellaceae bacterium]
MIFAIFVACSALLMGGCGDSSVENVYTFGVADWSFPGEDATFPDIPPSLQKVNNYLKSKGCPIDGLYYEGSDDKDTDRQAKAVFNQVVSNLSKAEIDALGLPAESWFKYRASRVDKSGQVVVGEYAYP